MITDIDAILNTGWSNDALADRILEIDGFAQNALSDPDTQYADARGAAAMVANGKQTDLEFFVLGETIERAFDYLETKDEVDEEPETQKGQLLMQNPIELRVGF